LYFDPGLIWSKGSDAEGDDETRMGPIPLIKAANDDPVTAQAQNLEGISLVFAGEFLKCGVKLRMKRLEWNGIGSREEFLHLTGKHSARGTGKKEEH